MAANNSDGTLGPTLINAKAEVDDSSSGDSQAAFKGSEIEDVVEVLSSNLNKSTELQSISEKQQGQTSEENSYDFDILPFNWEDLHSRYTEALKTASAKEDALVDEFEQFSEAFLSWANSSSDRENERAQKRLKTREMYVQMSEQELEEKKAHYTNVVEAFRGALRLLQSQSPRHLQRSRHG